MVTGRGASQERSRERRERLLRAAVELIAQRGVKAATHRAVAAHAGLPAPTTGYYFSTTAQLIEEALKYHVERRVGELGLLLDGATAGATSLEDLGQSVARALITGASTTGLAQYEVYLEAARNPALRAAVAASTAAFEQVASVRLAALGIRDHRRAAQAFVALADGFALHRFAFPQTFDEELELLRNGLRGLFLSYALEESEVSSLIASITPSLPGR